MYGRLARDVLGIKSTSDIAAYPAFSEWVQKHCPAMEATSPREMTEAMITE
jgi:hypothetical protein